MHHKEHTLALHFSLLEIFLYLSSICQIPPPLFQPRQLSQPCRNHNTAKVSQYNMADYQA